MLQVAETLRAELEQSEGTLVAKEAQLVELQADVAENRESVSRLRSALAALEGRPQPDMRVSSEGERAAHTREGAVAESASATRSKPAPEPDNPLAHLKCKGCGAQGTLRQQILQSSSGMPVNMLTCVDCGNQLPMGL